MAFKDNALLVASDLGAAEIGRGPAYSPKGVRTPKTDGSANSGLFFSVGASTAPVIVAAMGRSAGHRRTPPDTAGVRQSPPESAAL